MPRLFLIVLLACAAVQAISADRVPTFVNQKVSSRQIALNELVRIEFTTIPKQIDAVDPQASIEGGLALAASTKWSLIGRPTVILDEKTKLVRCIIALMPRQPGELELPTIPVRWLSGDLIVEFGSVKVDAAVAIGTERKELPREVQSVAGFAWATSRAELEKVILKEKFAEVDGLTVANPFPDLQLVLRADQLAEARLTTRGVTLAQAKDSFLSRWGLPMQDGEQSLVWLIGWTRITAVPTEGGVRLTFVREDVLARAIRAEVNARVFTLLDPVAPPGPASPRP